MGGGGMNRGVHTLVSPYTGIVRAHAELMRTPRDASVIKIGTVATESPELLGRELEHLQGGSGGAHHCRDSAFAAAVGETAERYSAAYVPEERLVLATAHELGGEAVDPDRFELFAPHQYAAADFPFRPFTRATRVRWTRGWSLTDRRPVLVPAQLVYLDWQCLHEEEEPIAASSSNGLACGQTRDAATLAGLLELIERDAFQIAWANRLSLPRLDVSGDPALVAYAARTYDRARLPYATIDLSLFHDVPVVLGVVRSVPDGGIAVGAAAAVDVREAWRKALNEAFAVSAWGRSLVRTDPHREFASDYDDVRTFAYHVHFYAQPENAPRAAFLDGSDEVRDARTVARAGSGDAGEIVAAVASGLAARGIAVYAVDVTAPDIAAAGLHVVKAVSPELVPLDAVYRGRFLGPRRLYHAAHELGLLDRPQELADLNHDPHPFP
jgi:ribosomal protein S12 methylthiotransferase accessory factor